MKKFILLLMRFLLLPFGLLYGLIMEIRNIFYDRGIFKIYRAPFPVISVGNIEAGGTGKTPFTIFLAGWLLQKKLHIAIVSRGYGRKSRGYRLVSDGQKILSDVYTAGDEAMLAARTLPGAIVMVSEKRTTALKILERDFRPDLVILDDAFQHRAVHRDLDLLLFKRPPQGLSRYPLPAGRLREFWFNIRRADYILLHEGQISGLPTGQILRKTEGVSDYFSSLPVTWQQFTYCAFTAIARPAAFFNQLRDVGLRVNTALSFPDHHWFSEKDLARIGKMAARDGCQALVCTGKDAVKLDVFADHPVLKKIPLHILKISDHLSDDTILAEKIKGLVDKFGD